MPLITEHSATIEASILKGDVHKKMETFYNPVMQSNRNISILLLNSIENKSMNIADPLAGSGIRSLRFLKELQKGKINHIFINDKKENFKDVFDKNLKSNKIPKTNISIFNEEASLFLLNRVNDRHKSNNFCGYFDYIDIDPFGSPNPFLDAAIARICRNGILAVTATDTAALTGTYPQVTKRKYWAASQKNYLMHELGLRILIRKIQLQGIQFDKAFTPILSYHKDHYLRVYLRNEKGKKKCDNILKQHQYFLFCPHCLRYKASPLNNEECECKARFVFSGRLWTGKLLDRKLITTMAKNNPFPEEQKFLNLLKEESRIDTIGFIDTHVIAKKNRTEVPQFGPLLKKLKGVRTHFSVNGIKTQKMVKDVLK